MLLLTPLIHTNQMLNLPIALGVAPGPLALSSLSTLTSLSRRSKLGKFSGTNIRQGVSVR